MLETVRESLQVVSRPSVVAVDESQIGKTQPPSVDVLRNRRERQAGKTIRAELLARGVGYGIRLVTIPLALGLLGPERYGLWLTVGSLIAWLGMSDLGLSQGLLSSLARAYGNDDVAEMRRLVSTGLLSFAALSGLVLVLVFGISSWDGLSNLIGVPAGSPLAADAKLLMVICGAVFAASFLFHAIPAVCQALQEGYWAAYAQIFGSVATVAGLSLLTWRGGTLVEFALVMTLPALMVNICLALYLFGGRHGHLRPSWRLWNSGSLHTVMGYGGPLLAVQLASFAIFYSTNLLIANRLGPAEVSRWAVAFALFMTVKNICFTLISPYLPAYAEATERSDWGWIQRRAWRSLWITVGLMSVASMAMLAFGQQIIRLWAGEAVVPGWDLLLAMSIYFPLMVWTDTTGVLLVGLGRVREKAALRMTTAIVYVGGCWLLLPSLGLVAAPLAGIVAFLVDGCCALPLALRYMRSKSTPAMQLT